jgi:serine/threonine protein kinase
MASHGRYTIVGKIADGGMAEIFLAKQHGAEGFEKPVVLKRILTAYSADPQFRNMMLDEAHISMSLQHGNIVQVLDLGVAAGRYFLALELVDGWDLEKILHRAHAAGIGWPAALSLYVAGEVCRGLAYAHGKTRDGKPLGIVHRDISPNNVLVSGEGEVKLADFGIAKAQRKREQTAAGVIKGKVAYMSPEQAAGGPIDRRSDIFSVGSMLYRMMTGRLAFEAKNDLESLLRVQKAEFTPPDEAMPGLSPAISAIIVRAMRLAPSVRYQTADEMLADVERLLRTQFQSAGQTELKLWLLELGRRDGAASIGKVQAAAGGEPSGVVETDLSAGTSFELGDLDPASGETELAHTSPPGDARPPPLPRSGSTAEIRKRVPALKGSNGFWLGVGCALAVMVAVRFALSWADKRGVVSAIGLHGGAPPTAPPPAAVGPAPAELEAAKPASSASASGDARPAVARSPSSASGPASVAADAAITDGQAGVPAAEKPAPKTADEDEQDEDALLRKADPNAASTLIGEDEAEPSRGTAGSRARPRAAANPVAAAGRSAAAILHIISTPRGAVVKTKARVLGRTPINLHFKAGNTYEIVFVKQGFEPLIRKVSVRGTKNRTVAVTLKRRPPAKRLLFFTPHR